MNLFREKEIDVNVALTVNVWRFRAKPLFLLKIYLTKEQVKYHLKFDIFCLLQLHLIHWNSTKYSSLEDALGKPDGIAIIALFIQVHIYSTSL